MYYNTYIYYTIINYYTRYTVFFKITNIGGNALKL